MKDYERSCTTTPAGQEGPSKPSFTWSVVCHGNSYRWIVSSDGEAIRTGLVLDLEEAFDAAQAAFADFQGRTDTAVSSF